MTTPSTPIVIKTPPAAVKAAPSMNPLDRLVASTSPAPAGSMIMGEKGPIPAAPALTIAPGLLPFVMKTPPAAPQPAPTPVDRHPLGVGDVLDRLVALEVSMRDIYAKTQGLLTNV